MNFAGGGAIAFITFTEESLTPQGLVVHPLSLY